MSDNPKIHFDLPTGVQATDLTQVFTSKPYPVVVIDATTARAKVEGARLWKSLDDATQPTATITTFELRPVLQATTVEPDATTTGLAEITALTLDTVLKATTVEPEATAASADLTSLTLESKLVATTVEPEATAASATITGITLE